MISVSRNIIITAIKHILFVFIVFTMIANNSTYNFYLLNNAHYELVDADGEEDVENEEKHEDDSKEDSKDFINFLDSFDFSKNNLGSFDNFAEDFSMDFSLEIQLPPPENT